MRLDVAVRPSYPVFIEAGLFERVPDLIQEKRLAIITDKQVAAIYASKLAQALESAGTRTSVYSAPVGEASKSLAMLEVLLRRLAQDGHDRSSAVLALGGGVVGDLAGFVAAAYMRGIAFYQLPTSLLAMVDASIGGKVGVNLPEGKNLVGAFWQPRAVIIDPVALTTLPDREFRQGAVELFKHGLIADASIVAELEKSPLTATDPPDRLASLIFRSVKVKADIVARDEREGGERAHLNLGHTLAHALESHTCHSLSHGDAVAYGMYFAASLSAMRGHDDETGRIRRFLGWLNPDPLPDADIGALERFIARDKKQLAGKRRWVLLERVGKPVLADDLGLHELEEAWRRLVSTFNTV